MKSASVKQALSAKWKVVDDSEDLSRLFAEYLSISIFTEDDLEVVGCSEWMRAEREVFEHIVALHNKSLKKKQGEQHV